MYVETATEIHDHTTDILMLQHCDVNCSHDHYTVKVISSMACEVNRSIASYEVPCWDQRESRLSFMWHHYKEVTMQCYPHCHWISSHSLSSHIIYGLLDTYK